MKINLQGGFTIKGEFNLKGRFNVEAWKIMVTTDRCFHGCRKFRCPMFKDYEGDGFMTLNPEYVLHVHSTHGIHPFVLVDMIADKLYDNEEDKKGMRELYSFLGKHK